MNDKRIVLIVLGATLLAIAAGIPVAINAARNSSDVNGDTQAAAPSAAANKPMAMTEEEERIAKASRDTGFTAEEIRDALNAARTSSAKPADDAEVMILALASLEYERRQKAGKIPVTPTSVTLDDLDARSAQLKERMDTLIERAKRDGMTAAVKAEDKAIREEAAEIEREYEQIRRR